MDGVGGVGVAGGVGGAGGAGGDCILCPGVTKRLYSLPWSEQQIVFSALE